MIGVASSSGWRKDRSQRKSRFGISETALLPYRGIVLSLLLWAVHEMCSRSWNPLRNNRIIDRIIEYSRVCGVPFDSAGLFLGQGTAGKGR